MKILKSENLNELVMLLNKKNVEVNCGKELVANTVDAAQEKHVPVVSVDGNNVSVVVGAVEHPMMEAHHIAFIILETTKGVQIKYLDVNSRPVADFVLKDEELVAVYEYCNLHGLWKVEM